MKRSLNELYRLCQKACEGAGAPDGLDVEAAHGSVWLAARGAPVLETLCTDQELTATRTSACVLDGVRIDRRNLDASAKAGALIAPSLVGFLVARAAHDGSLGTLAVTTLSAPLYLLPSAAYFADAGWRMRFSLTIPGNGSYELRADPSGARVLGPPRATLTKLARPIHCDLQAVCTRSDSDLSPGEGPLAVLLASDSIAQSEAGAPANGVDVPSDLWKRLAQYAARVLVPATEVSRQRGAGSGSTDSE